MIQDVKIVVKDNYPAHPPKIYFMNDVRFFLKAEYDQIWIKTIQGLLYGSVGRLRLVGQIYYNAADKKYP